MNHFDPRLGKMTIKAEKFWAPILIQAEAALISAQSKMILSKLGILRLQKPTQNMDKNEVGIFFSTIARELIKDGYSYFSIDQGIDKLIRGEDSPFFPTLKIIIKYIYPIHWKLKKRTDQLTRVFERHHA